MDDPLPEADRTGDAPHPRETLHLFGQDAAESTFLDAFATDRLHHAWLITGAKGTGKATLAWRIARFLLSTPPATDNGLFGAPQPPKSLETDITTPLNARISALSEPGLLLIRRPWDGDKKRLKAQITVDEVRKLGGFFGLSSTDGGRRVVIVDSVDDMNPSAANALLKVLEEPPKNAILLLVSHAPARLLPTIRSRCRELRADPLTPDDLTRALDQAGVPEVTPELAELSAGSVGAALDLLAHDGPATYARLITLLTGAPGMDRQAALKLAEAAAGRGKEPAFDMTTRLIDTALARLARTGAGIAPGTEAAPGEAETLSRLAPNPHMARRWAYLQQELSQRLGHGRAVNVDATSLLMDAFLKIDETARAS